MNIVIDPDILKNNWRCLGCIVATLQELKEPETKINRYAEYVARACIGNSKYTFNNFQLMKKKLKEEFGINIIKQSGQGFTIGDFNK